MRLPLRLLALVTVAGLAACSRGGIGSAVLPSAANNGTSSTIAGSARVRNDVAPAGWASTATAGATIANGTLTGALDPSTTLTVRLGLGLHNESQLQQLIASRQTVTPDAFMAQFGPTASEVQNVVSYLQSQGFTNVRSEGQLVSADGTAATATKAFNTTLSSFSLGGTSVYVNTTPAYVPTSLSGTVVAVLGLTNAAKMATPLDLNCFKNAIAPGGQCVPRFEAKTVQKFYDADATPTGSGATVAVIAEGNVSQVITDLRYAEAKQNLPQVPADIVTVGLTSSDTSGTDEWDLDTQSSTGMAQTVGHLYIYATTSLTDSDIANAYNHWVRDDKAKIGNSSFGECEYSAFLDGSMRVDDHLFEQGAAQGQTMFASTGDTGSSCAVVPSNGVPGSGPPMVSYPATSPYVVGVGGTSAIASSPDGSYVGEAAWNAGGGGISQFENATTWQQQAQLVTVGLAATNLRGLPDVAMAGDAIAGAYRVYGTNIPALGNCSNGCAVGGTSESSPLAAGAYARLLSAHPFLGFAAPHLYANYQTYQNSATTVTGPPPTQALGGFHDIITGGNGLYTAAPGYDYTTGLGTLDVGVMNQQIN